MDDVSQLILGGQPQIQKSQVQQSPQGAFTEQEIDNLVKTESSKNPYAINKETKAMGYGQFTPETLSTLHKQGIKFDPFDEAQSRNAIKTYLGNLVEQTGSKEKALAAYGGFKTKDPSQYINKILTPQQAQQPEHDDVSSLIINAIPIEEKPRQMNAGEKMFQDRMDFLKKTGQGLAGLADVTVGNVLPGIAGPLTYNIARALKQNEQQAKTKESQIVSGLEKPFGKTFGVTETPAYQNEALSQATRFIGENINKGAKWISEQTGIPEGDVQSYINTATLAVGAPAAKLTKKAVSSVAQKAISLGTEGLDTLRGFKQELPKSQHFEAQIPPKVSPGSAGAAAYNSNPYSLTGEELARDGAYPIVKLSKMAKAVGKNEQAQRASIASEITNNGSVRPGVASGEEQTLRNEHVKAKSSNQTPEGDLIRQQLADEQNGLSNYAQKIVDETGASPTLTTPEKRGRLLNDTFTGPEGLSGHFKQEKNRIYEEARKKQGDNPIEATNFENLINSPIFKAELKLGQVPDFLPGVKELYDLHKESGLPLGEKNGVLDIAKPGSLAGLNGLSQYINKSYSPQTKYYIGRVMDALNEDIAKAGGEGLYRQAKDLHIAEKSLFGSKGIKTLFGELDNNGVQTATPLEKITDRLNNMPTAEWRHIYDLAEQMSNGKIQGKDFQIPIPKELQQAATQAKNEMLGSIARDVYQAGADKMGEWNYNSANKVLNSHSDKIAYAFDPEIQRKFHVLNYGGHLMPAKHPYEGGGLQLERVGLLQEKLPQIGEVVGAFKGGPIGAFAGRKTGEAVQAKMTNKDLQKQAKSLEKEMKNLSDLGKTK
jgi:hypothetical protein